MTCRTSGPRKSKRFCSMKRWCCDPWMLYIVPKYHYILVAGSGTPGTFRNGSRNEVHQGYRTGGAVEMPRMYSQCDSMDSLLIIFKRSILLNTVFPFSIFSTFFFNITNSPKNHIANHNSKVMSLQPGRI